MWINTLPAFLGSPFLPLRFHTHKQSISKSPIQKNPQLCARTADPITSNPLGPPEVICVGEVLYDLLTESPTASVTDTSMWTPYLGGGAANVASGLARLSTASAFIGRVGNDNSGSLVRNALNECNVNIDGIQTAIGKRTRNVFVRRSETGEATFVGFDGERSEFADTTALDMESLPGVLLYAAKVLMTGTLSLASEGSGSTLVELVELAKVCKIVVVADINWRPVFWEGWRDADARERILDFLQRSPGVDIVKTNVEEVNFLFGKKLGAVALEEPIKVLEAFGSSTGVIVTAAEKGASYAFLRDGDFVAGYVAASTAATDVVDTTGAGDAFLAGFLSEMLRLGGPPALRDEELVRQIGEFAAEVAAFVVKGKGAIDPQPAREAIVMKS